MTIAHPCLEPITLPLTVAFNGTSIRANSLTITTFIESSLRKPAKAGGIAAYVRDQAIDNNETVGVLSEGTWVTDYEEKPEWLDTCLWSLNRAYAQHLELLAECQALLQSASKDS